MRDKAMTGSIFFKALVAGGILVFLASGCASFPGAKWQPLTQDEIVQLAQANTPDAQILDRIRKSRTAYRLTAQEIVSLHNAGVSFTVIDYMLQTYIDKVRDDQRFYDERYWWFHHHHFYWRHHRH
jgi:hypothetical protein